MHFEVIESKTLTRHLTYKHKHIFIQTFETSCLRKCLGKMSRKNVQEKCLGKMSQTLNAKNAQSANNLPVKA